MAIIFIIGIIGIVVFLASRKKQLPTREIKNTYQRTVSPTLPEDFGARHTKDKEPLVYLETLNFNELPKSIISHLDIVRTIRQWNEFGFKPKRKDDYDNWNDVKREERYFEFVGASYSNPRHKKSLETGKRITSNPYYIKALVAQGISVDGFIDSGEDITHFISAENLFRDQSYEEALKEINSAIAIRPLKEYQQLQEYIQVKLGNIDTVQRKFNEYEYDIDSAIHVGEIFDWFKALLKNNELEKVIFYFEKTNETLDKLSKGLIKPKIYGQQSADWYLYKKEDFHKNLYRIFDLDSLNLSKSEVSIKLFEMFIQLYSGKETKPIENIADVYSKWGLKDEAVRLYNKCLSKLANEEKPRAKSRLNKKISELSK